LCKARSGYWVVMRKTASKRLCRSLKALWAWCRWNRHMPVKEQHRMLGMKLQGHYGYYGIRGNYRLLEQVYEKTLMAWRRWLGTRSSKGSLSYKAFNQFMDRFPLPKPRIVHAI